MSLTSSSATVAPGKSTQTFVTALVTGLVVAGIYLAIFMIIRNSFRKIYQPRSYMVEPSKRVEPLPHGLLAWIPAVLTADATQLIHKNGLDAYLFVRYLWLMMEIFFPFMLVTWAILLPVDSVNVTSINSGIEIFTIGNVANQPTRYAAHVIVVWFLTFYVLYLIKRELAIFVVLRQDFLISAKHAKLAQSRTVLVTGVPAEFLTVDALTKFTSVLPGGVERIWLCRKLEELPDLHKRRAKACSKLEGAETSLLRKAAKAIRKKTVKDAPSPGEMENNKSLAARYVPAKQRPSHKLGFLGLFGTKVDTIEWAREEIATTTRLLEEARSVLNSIEADKTYPAESAAFIQFNDQMAAHMFAQCLAHQAPLRMSARYIEVAQEDVIWHNLSIKPYQAKGRYAISWAVTIGLIILWSFPVAFVGLLSNISSLCISAPWLSWLCKLPSPVNGIIQGSLPPIALAVLFLVLPVVLRLLGDFQGIPLKTAIELSLMDRYFLFLVIHGFLIVTLSSGLVAAIPAISKNPASAVTLLATKLPAASTFFLTYFVTTSIAGAAGDLLQVVSLILYYVKLFLLGSTPRSVFQIKFGMSTVSWGTLFPNMTLLTVIGLVYSVIAPLVSGFAFLAFALFWFTYKYLFLWVIDTPSNQETGGLFYPKALKHIFVGLYIEQICLTGLFFLARTDGKQSGLGPGIVMIILIVITAFFHLTMLSGYNPLISYLPLSAADKIHDVQRQTHAASRPLSDEKGEMASSQRSREEEKEIDSATFPPAPRRSEDAGFSSLLKESQPLIGEEEHLGLHAFDHPATYELQQIVWFPRDVAGLWQHEVESTEAAGVEVSTDGAQMNDKGRVTVSRAPPGDDWDPTQDLDGTVFDPPKLADLGVKVKVPGRRRNQKENAGE